MKTWYRMIAVLVVALLFGAAFVSSVSANPPAQDPRPPTDGGGDTGSGGNGGGNGGDGDSQPAAPQCAAINGEVLSWGVGPFAGIGITLGTGSWQVDAVSGSDGRYAFGGLGIGVAQLQMTLPPELQSSLRPLVPAAPVYLNCDYPLVANLAIYSGDTIEPPVTLEMSAPSGVTPGENTVIRLLVENNLPTPITAVNITNQMPFGFTNPEITTAADAGVSQIVGSADGQLAFIYFEEIPAGGEENILITVSVLPQLPAGTQINNTATLFYRESVAVQASLNLTAGAAGQPLPAAVPPTTTPLPQPAAVITATAEITRPAVVVEATPTPTPAPTLEPSEGEDFVPPDGLPKTGDDFFPPPAILPETGTEALAIPPTLPNTGLGLLLPLSGLGLGGVAFLLHQLRAAYRDDHDQN